MVDLTLMSKTHFIPSFAIVRTRLCGQKQRVTATYQKNLLKAAEKFSNNLPHLRHQLEYAQWSQAAENQ